MTKHQELVAQLLNAGWTEPREWRKAVRAVAATEPWCGDGGTEAEDVSKILADCRVTPDAWRLVVEGPDEGWCYPVIVLEVAEAVVRHDLDAGKLAIYEEMWMNLDALDHWYLRLWRVDLSGTLTLIEPRFIAEAVA